MSLLPLYSVPTRSRFLFPARISPDTRGQSAAANARCFLPLGYQAYNASNVPTAYARAPHVSQ